MEDDLKLTEEQLKMPNVTMGLQTLTKKNMFVFGKCCFVTCNFQTKCLEIT